MDSVLSVYSTKPNQSASKAAGSAVSQVNQERKEGRAVRKGILFQTRENPYIMCMHAHTPIFT